MEGFLSKKYKLIKLLNDYDGLLFSVEIPFKTDIEIVTVYLDSMPFTALVGGVGDITGELVNLGITYIEIEQNYKLEVLADMVARNIGDIITDVEIISDIGIDLKGALAKHLKTSLEEQFLIDIKMREPTSKSWGSKQFIDFEILSSLNYGEIKAMIVEMAKEVIVEIDVDYSVSKLLQGTIDNFIDVKGDLKSLNSQSFKVLIPNFVNLGGGLEIMENPNAFGVIVEIVSSFVGALILLGTTRLSSILRQTSAVIVSFALGKLIRLSDLNSKSLSQLNDSKLEELYFEII